MMNVKDISGQVFGRLTAIKRHPKKNGKDHHVYWECVCVCGNKKIASGANLRGGKVPSCGCLRAERMRELRRKELMARYGESSKSRVFGHYKSNSVRNGREFSITKEDFLRLTKLNCHYCNAEPSNENKSLGRVFENGNYTYNGLDRVDNLKGYSLDNVVPCCKTCNVAKRNLSVEEFKNWVKQIYSNLFEGEK